MADDIEARLRELLEKARVTPLAYRSAVHDDWGTIRGGGLAFTPDHLHFIALVRDSRVDHDCYPKHRAAGTDPYEDVTRLFVEGVNALPDLLDEISRLRSEAATLRARVKELEIGLGDCAKRLRTCAEIGGNAPFAVDALCSQFDTLLTPQEQH